MFIRRLSGVIFEFGCSQTARLHFVWQPSGTYSLRIGLYTKNISDFGHLESTMYRSVCNVLTVKVKPARPLSLFSPVMKSSCIPASVCFTSRETDREKWVDLCSLASALLFLINTPPCSRITFTPVSVLLKTCSHYPINAGLMVSVDGLAYDIEGKIIACVLKYNAC